MSIGNTLIAGPRGRGRPTHYSEELVEEFCGLIVDGLTVRIACQQTAMPGPSTIYEWLARYPEFRRRYEAAVLFRNQCFMDDCIDIADATGTEESLKERKFRADMRMRQLGGMGLKIGRPRS